MLRTRVWREYRRSAAACDAGGCVGREIATDFDAAILHGYSYATAVPATALIGATGYVFGRTARRSVTPLVGGFLLGAGALTWAVPRLALLSGRAEIDWRPRLTLLDATFYTGMSAMGAGAAMLAWRAGVRSRPERAVSVAVVHRGVVVSGRF